MTNNPSTLSITKVSPAFTSFDLVKRIVFFSLVALMRGNRQYQDNANNVFDCE